MSLPILTSRSRVLLFAPHPDDESLAAGVYLQRALAGGAAVKVVYATDGERNCWPQRVFERRLRLGETDRARWGARRRAEALAALRVIGVDESEVEFLSLPDQGVTDLLLAEAEQTAGQLARAISRWRPTHLLLPSARDTHPDHSGLAVLLRLALEGWFSPSDFLALHYLVHGGSQIFGSKAHELPHSRLEEKRKRRAILCHASQVALSRRRFLSYAQRPERFVVSEKSAAPEFDGPIRSLARGRNELRLHVSFQLKPLRGEETSLYLLGHDSLGRLHRLRAKLPGRTARLDLIEGATGALAGLGHYRGDAFRAEIALPTFLFDPTRSLFMKLDRRVWFFDEAGWMEIPAIMMRGVVPVSQLAVA